MPQNILPHDQPLPRNFSRLRRARGLSQAELAARAGLSRLAVHNIEHGASVPHTTTLLALARALEADVAELLRPCPILNNVRFRSTARMRGREQILCDVARWLTDFNELEEALGDPVPWKLEEVRRAIRSRRADPAKAAILTRQFLKLGEGEVVRDVCGLIESAGVKVLPTPVRSDGFFGLSIGLEDGGPAIVVNTDEHITVERRIATAAHELGHLLLHLDAYDVTLTAENKTQEREANVFASHFLMPEPVFIREWSDARGLPFTDRVLKVKRIFRVSYKSVLMRLPPLPGQNLFQRFQLEWQRAGNAPLGNADEPLGLRAGEFRGGHGREDGKEPEKLSEFDFREDRLPKLVRRALEAEEISLGRAAEILRLNHDAMRQLARAWVV